MIFGCFVIVGCSQNCIWAAVIKESKSSSSQEHPNVYPGLLHAYYHIYFIVKIGFRCSYRWQVKSCKKTGLAFTDLIIHT